MHATQGVALGWYVSPLRGFPCLGVAGQSDDRARPLLLGAAPNLRQPRIKAPKGREIPAQGNALGDGDIGDQP